MELSQLQQRQASLDDVTAAATADLSGFYQSIAGESPDRVAAQLRAATPAVINQYGEVAGTMAADWYEQTRPKPGFLAQTATPSLADSMPGMLGWALAPLFSDTGSDTLERLVGGVQRLILLFDRDTIDSNVVRDPLAEHAKRIALPGACAFCAYMSTVTDNTDEDTKKYHDHCHCIPAPGWKGDQIPAGEHDELWSDAAAKARNEIEADYWAKRKLAPDLRRSNFYRKFPETAINTKNIVARMREQLGTH